MGETLWGRTAEADMSALVQIIDEVPGSAPRPAVKLRLVSEKVTARELIRRRVEHEVAEYNRRPSRVFHGLVQPTDAERALNGYRLKRPRPLDRERQVEAALAAFSSNGYFMLVDDRQVESLDDELVLTETSVVNFVRLVPLVGG